MLAALLLMACDGGPVIYAVEPSRLAAGEGLVIRGENLGDTPEIVLLRPDGEAVALAAGVTDHDAVPAVVPVEMKPGTYDIRVRVGEALSEEPTVLVVDAPREEEPCRGEYTANTRVSLARGEAGIDRQRPGMPLERIRVPIAEIAGVEYEHRRDAAGSCFAIWLKRTDGRRSLFDDDRTLDLEDRASRLAKTLSKPFRIARDDGGIMSP